MPERKSIDDCLDCGDLDRIFDESKVKKVRSSIPFEWRQDKISTTEKLEISKMIKKDKPKRKKKSKKTSSPLGLIIERQSNINKFFNRPAGPVYKTDSEKMIQSIKDKLRNELLKSILEKQIRDKIAIEKEIEFQRNLSN